ncbi:hypothetical protein V1502_19290 [Bacillus sp. SCS-153A]|uniref:hypothetical protein n=1 Tax=Rossellomorea sedimentorum TaxID=3115294 RepID=UPI0039060C36
MKKQVWLLHFLPDGVRFMNVRDFYLVFRGRYKDDSILLTSIGNYTLAMQSLNVEDLTSEQGFVSFLPIPLSGSTKFLLRADVKGVKSILVLSVDEKRLQIEPATEFDELSDDIFQHILHCFSVTKKDNYISFLLRPHENTAAKRRHRPPNNDNHPE